MVALKKSKKTRRKHTLAVPLPPLTHAQLEQILGKYFPHAVSTSNPPAVSPSNPPPPPVAPKVAPGAQGPTLWHFQHTRPGIAGILHCVVQAPDIQNARGAAYLISEQFGENVIGFIKAGAAPQLPQQ
jgi:hypothetical protein